MLMQSHLNEIHLLPALPSAWKTGKITGLCAEQGFVVDIEWENNRLKMAVLLSKCGEHAIIRCRDKVKILHKDQEVRYSLDDYARYIFSTQKGQRYLIKCM